jgi:hypothetical protein
MFLKMVVMFGFVVAVVLLAAVDHQRCDGRCRKGRGCQHRQTIQYDWTRGKAMKGHEPSIPPCHAVINRDPEMMSICDIILLQIVCLVIIDHQTDCCGTV